MRIHHLALRTLDVPRLAAFYRDVLGLPLANHEDAPGRVWLQASGTVIMIEPRDASEPGPERGSLDLVAFAIEPDERAGFVDRLVRAGIAIEGETAFTVYFRDPDGRRVGVSHYVF